MTKIILKDRGNSGYNCIIGSYGALMTAVQAAKISYGTSLENLIYQNSEFKTFKKSLGSKSKEKTTTDFADFLTEFKTLIGTKDKRIGKLAIKEYEDLNNTEVDMVFVNFETCEVYICEIKAGSNFDTKKAKGETEQLKRTRAFLEKKLPSTFSIETLFVLWDIDDVQNASFKCPAAQKYLTSGPDFARMIQCSYSEVQEILQKDVSYNQRLLEHEFERIRKAG